MKKVLKVIGFLFLTSIIVVVLVLGYLGFVPGVSALFGSNKPRNLGVKYTAKDLETAQTKLGQKVVEPQGNPYEHFKNAPGHEVDTTLTQEEYSAHIEQIHPVSDFQIKLDGESFEMSGRIDKSRIPAFVRTWGITEASDGEILDAINKFYPGDPVFYLAGTGGAKKDDLQVNITKAELGRLPIPADQAREVVEAYTELLFNQVPGFSVEESTVENGKLHFKGSAVTELPKY